jgi:hypothetical protein
VGYSFVQSSSHKIPTVEKNGTIIIPVKLYFDAAMLRKFALDVSNKLAN